MYDDLRDEQTIIVYDASGIAYIGKVGNMSGDMRRELHSADFYLLDKEEEYDIIAII